MLQEEFTAGTLPVQPNDLPAGDLGCDGRALRKPRAPRAAGTKRGRGGGASGPKKRKQRGAGGGDDDEDDEDDDVWPVEMLVDRRVAGPEDPVRKKGSVLYLVVSTRPACELAACMLLAYLLTLAYLST